MEMLLQDVRYAVRSLLRARAYALAVVVTLGLGIGANTAIFSIIYGVLIQPLPYAQGDRLVFLRQPQTAGVVGDMGFSVHDIQDIRARSRSLESVAEYHAMTFTLLGRGEAELVQTGVVSTHYFELLGMRPIVGRDFVESDDRSGAEPVLILSYGYWQRRFGGDESIVGEAMEMNGRMHNIIGVLPPVPQFPDQNDVYMTTSSCPVRSDPAMVENRNMRMMSVFGRALPGVAVEQVGTDMEGVAAQLAAEYPEAYDASAGQTFEATLLKEELVQNARPVFLTLLATAGLVLLIACANVANLGLARLSRRSQEMSLRAALGAGTGRLFRQLLTENLVLALAGGAVGVLVASFGHDVLVGFAARFTPRAHEATLSLPVLGFTLAASILAGLVFGLAPAWTAGRRLAAGLREGKGNAGPGRGRVQAGLVVAQVALAFVLVIGCGLTVRSFWLLQRVDPGFDPVNVLSMDVTLNGMNSTLSVPERRDFYFALAERLGAMAGVEAVGLTSGRALDQEAMVMQVGIRAEGNAEQDVARLAQATGQLASEGYLPAMGIPLVEGRAFTSADADLTGFVAMVSESFARTFFPGVSPLGRTFEQCFPWNGQCQGPFEVVGVVADHRDRSLESDPAPRFYRASRQSALPGGTVVIRTTGDPSARARQFIDVVHELNPDAPVSAVATLEERVNEALAPRRLTMVLLTLFALVALAVSLAGIAGVVSFSVSQRTREIGVRLALGATPKEVLMQITGRGALMVGAGLSLGVGAAAAARHFASTLLWGIPALDPTTWLGALVVLGSVSMLACWLPARRATTIDPLEALRED